MNSKPASTALTDGTVKQCGTDNVVAAKQSSASAAAQAAPSKPGKAPLQEQSLNGQESLSKAEHPSNSQGACALTCAADNARTMPASVAPAQKLAETSKASEQSAEVVAGSRISVFWDDDAAWYPGIVRGYKDTLAQGASPPLLCPAGVPNVLCIGVHSMA